MLIKATRHFLILTFLFNGVLLNDEHSPLETLSEKKIREIREDNKQRLSRIRQWCDQEGKYHNLKRNAFYYPFTINMELGIAACKNSKVNHKLLHVY